MVSTSARNAGDPWFESRSWYDRFLYVNIHLFIYIYIYSVLSYFLSTILSTVLYVISSFSLNFCVYILNIFVYYLRASWKISVLLNVVTLVK